jgi:DNA-binding CsgD family transcriptional regulator
MYLSGILSIVDSQDVIENTITMIKFLDEPWGIKDISSLHVYMNGAARHYTNTPLDFTIEGKMDCEFPVLWSELCEELQEHDRLTASAFRRVSVIETHYWNGSSSLSPYISDKIPLFNKRGQCIGTLWNAKKVKPHSSLIYINQAKPSVLTSEPPIALFGDKELQVIFLLMQNLTCKDMAKILNVSPRTIESRLNIIYQKVDVHSMHQLKDFCKSIGLDSYIPESLLTKGVQYL